MKKILITLIIVLLSYNNLIAQNNKRDKLKVYKTAFITERLDLTPLEAEKFWPVYNQYQKKIHELKISNFKKEHQKIKEKGGIDSLTETEANTLLNKLVKNEKAITTAKTKLYSDLRTIISSKKILKLYNAENEFNRKLLMEYRKKQMMNAANRKH